jgi:hypothetical protein
MDKSTTAIVLILEVIFFVLVFAWFGYKLLAAKPAKETTDPDALADELGLPRHVTLSDLERLPSRAAGEGPAVFLMVLLAVALLFILGLILGLF